MDVPLDAKVICTDGSGGWSICSVLNPVSDRITHVVVKDEAYSILSRLVPVERILSSNPQEIRLSCTKAELAMMDVFSESEFIPYNLSGTQFMLPYSIPVVAGITLEHEKVPSGELALRRGSSVEARDGYVGTLDEFIVEPVEYRITHLVLRKGHLWDPRDVTIPVRQIDRIAGHTIYLKASKAEIGALPAVKVKRRWP
jgi:sporulation protein YlmC with PRC-barrel domain